MVPELAEMEGMRGEVEKHGNELVVAAKELAVTNQEQLNGATNFMLFVVDARKQVTDKFNPIIKKAHETHKTLLAFRNEITDPFDKAEKLSKLKINIFLTEQENLRRIREEELREQTKDSGLPPPVLPAMPTPEGMHRRPVLKIRVTDMLALCAAVGKGNAPEEVVVINESAIRDLVKKRGVDYLNLPGVEAFYEKTVVAKR